MPDVANSLPCWRATDARAVLVTEALAGDDALFLATHSALRDFRVGGSHASDVHERSEEGLLRALSDPSLGHAFCVVQGEPGSGKSHLIRWLSVNWPDGGDLCLLIQRADGSLDGTLRQLQARLPTEFRHLFDRLGQQQAAGISGRSLNFLVTLGASLEPDYFSSPFDDAEWCRANQPGKLILNTQVRDNWRGPRRILELMSGVAGRDSESAVFNLGDVLDLVHYCPDVHDSPAAERLARQLIKEAEHLRDLADRGVAWEDAASEGAEKARHSLSLVTALNRRRNHAVQNVIGVSADGLKRLFEELRAALKARGRRLVLLLEDVTSWQGLDDSLVDALVTDAETRPAGDLCPLVSVVGVTSQYSKDLAANYVQRITHAVHLGEGQGRLEDVASLRDPADRAAFVSRYLAASRAGPAKLAAWRERFRTDRALSPPNECLGCHRRDACHPTFGAVGDVGLFPFTHDAVEGFFRSLKVDDGGMTHRTPRGLLQGILGPTMLNPGALEAGRYPGPEVEPAVVDRVPLPGLLTRRIELRVTEERERQRLRRLLAYWGNGRSAMERDGGGRETYAGLSRGLLAAFGLPWMADDVAEVPPPFAPVLVPVQPPAPDLPPGRQIGEEADAAGSALSPVRSTRSRSSERAQGGPASPTPSGSKGKAPGRRDVEKARDDIEALRQGRTLASPTVWNGVVHEVLRRVDPRRIGVDRWTFGRLFTAELVKIEQTGQQRSNHFVIPREEWLAEGLEAYATLKAEAPTEEEVEYSRGRLANMVRRTERLAAKHVAKLMPVNADGSVWLPVVAVAQTLLLRAWLRGATSSDRPLHEQWEAVLGDEAGAESAPTARIKPWQDALLATRSRQEALRDALREMVSLPQGDANTFGLADASITAAALARLRDDFAFDVIPPASKTLLGTSDVETFRELAERLAAYVQRIPTMERGLLADRSSNLLARLRGRPIVAHLRRVDSVARTVSNVLPSAEAAGVRDWVNAFERQAKLLAEVGATKAVEVFMMDVLPNSDADLGRGAALLSRLAQGPVADLKAVLDLAMQGDDLVCRLLPHVRDLITEGGRGASLTKVHEAGRVFAATLERLAPSNRAAAE